MKAIDMLELITSDAKRYHKTCNASLNRNKHMNNLEGKAEIPQESINAILTDFINYIASRQCIDYGLYTTDLREEETANMDKQHR